MKEQRNNNNVTCFSSRQNGDGSYLHTGTITPESGKRLNILV
jgi:hypothetical protein